MTSINPLDYFSKTELPDTYDFNNDGKVDIADYNYAISTLENDDVDDDVAFTKDQLDAAFAKMLKDATGSTETDVTEENAEELAKEIISAVNSGKVSPSAAQTLKDLQTIGKTLTKYIKQSADIARILSTQIERIKGELEDIQEEKDLKAQEYDDKKQEVEQKTSELDAKIQRIDGMSKQVVNGREATCSRIIKQCVEDYKDGKYPNEQLTTVILKQLAGAEGGFDVSSLRREINNSTSLGQEIKSICSDITTLVSDIRDVTSRYNDKNATLNSLTTSRNDVLAASNTASQEYQKGYQRRIDMRKEIVDFYHVAGSGERNSSNNPQVQKLGLFLDNKELDNMPFADAWNIMKETFNDCGISYNDKTGKISVPWGHDAAAKEIYKALVESLQKNFGVGTVQQEAEEPGYEDPTTDTPGVTEIKRNDPISFVQGDKRFDFIIDRNGDGVLNDASEFLGAQNGWDEMKAYDMNGDGQISGDELKELKIVSIDQTSGQYNFTNAADAGVTSINLNSYQSVDEMQLNGDINVGTFKLQMNDGKEILGQQTEDTMRNLNNKYTTLFGSEIEDQTDMYNEENPFMEEFVETVDTAATVATTQTDIKKSKIDSDTTIKRGDEKNERTVVKEAHQAQTEKARDDAKAEKKAAKEQAEKEEAEKAEKAAEEKKAEEEKAKKSKAKKK